MDPQGANPIIRSGLEVLHGSGRLHSNPGVPLPPSLSALSGYPGAFSHEAFLNPAFRLPFPGGPGYPQGYPTGVPSASGSPYVSYTRVKTPSGGESIVPVCRDPYCTGCQFSAPPGSAAAAGMMPSGGICPAGCAQCDHQKIPYASFYPQSASAAAFLSQPGAAAFAMMQHHQQQQVQQHHHQQQQQQHQHQQAAAAAAAAAASSASQQQRPYICNWIVGDNYCGKKFQNSEELLQHLRTHTQNTANGAAGQAANAEAAAMLAAQQQHQQMAAAAAAQAGLYSQFFNQSSALAAMQQMQQMQQQHQQRGYPGMPGGPQAMSPYSAAAAAAAAGKGFPPGYFPSPYGMYGQRALP
jgi:hypothetical protein